MTILTTATDGGRLTEVVIGPVVRPGPRRIGYQLLALPDGFSLPRCFSEPPSLTLRARSDTAGETGPTRRIP